MIQQLSPQLPAARLAQWMCLAFGLRAIAAATHPHWGHPDEWSQTLEYAQYLANGTMIYTGEASLHLRGLFWPALLALPVKLASLALPGSIFARFYAAQLFTGALSLGALWGYWQVYRKFARGEELDLPASAARFRDTVALALWVLPWFVSADAVRPSQENAAQIALWIALGAWARGWPVLAGAAAVAIAACKFPAGLFSVGLAAAVFAQAARAGDGRAALRFAAGLALGLVACGLPDAIVYGRPWEALWMHSLYNVFSGQSRLDYGTQSPLEYWHLLTGHWAWALLPMGCALAVGFVYQIGRSLKRLEPWACAFAVYTVGHLLIPHKEPRFGAPAEGLLVYGGVAGCLRAARAIAARRPDLRERFLCLRLRQKRLLTGAVAALLLLPNAALLLGSLWGTTWRADSTYFELPRHLRETPDACAIVSVRTPMAVTLPELPLGYYMLDRKAPALALSASQPLVWVERVPRCLPGQSVLFHVYRPEIDWDGRGCQLLPSGLLAWLPRAAWPTVIARGWAAGSWYKCPAQALAAFGAQETRPCLARGIRPLAELPRFGATGEELARLARDHVPPGRDTDGAEVPARSGEFW